MNISGMGNVYTFQYYKESLADIVKAMKINLELEDPEPIKTFSFSAKEEYEEYVAGKNYSTETRKTTLPNFVGSNISYAQSWASARSIGITVNEIMEGNPLYNASLPDGYILSQSVAAGTETSKIYSITLSVIAKPSEQSSNQPKQTTDDETTKTDNQTSETETDKETTPTDNPGGAGDDPQGEDPQGGTGGEEPKDPVPTEPTTDEPKTTP